jgi:hypothetical protein
VYFVQFYQIWVFNRTAYVTKKVVGMLCVFRAPLHWWMRLCATTCCLNWRQRRVLNFHHR